MKHPTKCVCEGRGWYYVANGPDDYDAEECLVNWNFAVGPVEAKNLMPILKAIEASRV